jgi:flagella basal body P-ring formation protein FlgA
MALTLGVAGFVHAQNADGPIVIPGNAETNPAAAAAMASRIGMPGGASASSTAGSSAAGVSGVSRASGLHTPPPRGYQAATHAADAAMRSAALALDSRAEAADDSMSDAGGMIVIPGTGEPKAAAAAAPARSADTGGMITIPGPGEPKAGPAPATANRAETGTRIAAQPAAIPNPSPTGKSADAPANTPVSRAPAASASHDVIPVVVAADKPAPSPRGAAVRPIAAASPVPVAGVMPVSMRMPAPGAARREPIIAATAAPAGATQDGESVRAAALAFVQQQTAGLPGKVDVTITPVFPRGLAPCASLDPFMPTGARLWGRTTVGVRCAGERPWTLYLQVRISVNATYYLAARAIAPGEVLTNADLVARDGDLTAMPQAVVTDASQAVGAVALSRVPAGLPLRTDMLRGATSVSIGQSVRVVADGSGFSISAEGSAMNNAAPGQQVRVKTAGGQIITGVVKDAQTVEIRL